MRTQSLRVEVTEAEESDGTTGHTGLTRIANGEMGVRGDATRPVRIGRLHNSGPPGRTAQQAATQAPAHIGRELQTHLAETGMNRFRTKSNRQPSRSTFYPRNALFRKSSNKSSRGTPLILYLV